MRTVFGDVLEFRFLFNRSIIINVEDDLFVIGHMPVLIRLCCAGGFSLFGRSLDQGAAFFDPLLQPAIKYPDIGGPKVPEHPCNPGNPEHAEKVSIVAHYLRGPADAQAAHVGAEDSQGG